MKLVKLLGNVCIDENFSDPTNISSVSRVVNEKCGFNDLDKTNYEISLQLNEANNGLRRIETVMNERFHEMTTKLQQNEHLREENKNFTETTTRQHQTFVTETMVKLENCHLSKQHELTTLRTNSQKTLDREVTEKTNLMIKVERHEATIDLLKTQIEEFKNTLEYKQQEISELQTQNQDFNLKSVENREKIKRLEEKIAILSGNDAQCF